MVDLKKLAMFLKKVTRSNMVLAVIMAILAEALVEAMIPGRSLIEVVISTLIAVIVFFLTSRQEKPVGMIANLHQEYAHAS